MLPRIKENILAFLVALALVVFIRANILSPFKIPSGSMLPTLQIGDHIFANLWAYGLPVPFIDWLTEHTSYLGDSEPPARGDIVVFRFPSNPSLYFVKRVVGLPGDTIEIRAKALFLNGVAVPRVPVSDDSKHSILQSISSWRSNLDGFEVFEESLSDRSHIVLIDRNSVWDESFMRTQVPSGHVFVLGDNRDHSHDSRHWGTVPMDRIRGRAQWVWLSVEEADEGSISIRWDRFLKSL